MNKILATLLAIILGNCISFAQARTEKLSNETKDTLEIKNKINVTTDTTLHQYVARYDTAHYNLKMQNTYKNTFKLKNDTFREKMKEPWLGGILKDIFFR